MSFNKPSNEVSHLSQPPKLSIGNIIRAGVTAILLSVPTTSCLASDSDEQTQPTLTQTTSPTAEVVEDSALPVPPETPEPPQLTKEEVMKLLNSDPTTVLLAGEQFEKQPWAGEIMKKAAKQIVDKDPLIVLLALELFVSQPWAGEIMMVVADKEPELTLQSFLHYKDQPWAGEVAVKAANNNIEFAVSHVKKTNSTESWAIELSKVLKFNNNPCKLRETIKGKLQNKEHMMKSAKENPIGTLGTAMLLEGQPFEKEVVETAVKSVSENEYELAMFHLDLFVDEPYAEAFILKIAKKDPMSVIRSISDYMDRPWAEKVVFMALEKDPGAIGHQIESFVDQPWAREIVLKIAEKDPKSILYRIESFVGQPWAGEAILKAAEKDPKTALYRVGTYANQPWARKILVATAGTEPSTCLYVINKHYKLLKGKAGVSDAIEIAANKALEKEPYVILGYKELFAGQTWGEELIKAAKRKVGLLQ